MAVIANPRSIKENKIKIKLNPGIGGPSGAKI
jgi:hypothetical protein